MMGGRAAEAVDYCTLWPDRLFGFDWSRCCALHDIAYGANSGKFQADYDLMICVAKTGTPLMGLIMFLGVTVFGFLYYNRKTP